MHLEHVAIWTQHLERLCQFYRHYFDAQVGPRYDNPAKQFSSHFLHFASGARLELMAMAGIEQRCIDPRQQFLGIIHLAFAAGSKEAVDAMYQRLVADGQQVLDAPRWTGDGYYEFTLLDPDGNRLEVTV